MNWKRDISLKRRLVARRTDAGTNPIMTRRYGAAERARYHYGAACVSCVAEMLLCVRVMEGYSETITPRCLCLEEDKGYNLSFHLFLNPFPHATLSDILKDE